MIDIIIPAYNSHKTINRAIDSVLSQSYQDYHITIVNDGGEPYNINNIDCLTELRYNENKGPGYARNYGIDHTNGDYTLFIDADDYLESSYALQSLLNCFKEDIVLVIGGIHAETPDGGVRLIRSNGNFMHGKMYKRSFIEKYNIRANENSRCCEDDSFNSLFLLCMDKPYKDVSFSEPVYRWTYNTNSLGRKNPDEWEHKIVPRGMLINKIYVFNELEKRNIHNDRIIFDKVRTMLKCIVLYFTNQENFPQYDDSNKDVLIRCYYDIYRDLDGTIPDKLISYILKTFNMSGEEKDVNAIKNVIAQLREICN